MERTLAQLNQAAEHINNLLKTGGYTQEIWKTALDKLKVANAAYNKAVRLAKYAELAQSDNALVLFLNDFTCEGKNAKPVEDKETKKISYALETGVQELYLDEFDDYVHKCANPAWKAQLKVFAREMGVYKLKRFNRASNEKDIATKVRDAFELESEVRADAKTKLLELLQTTANMVIPGLEMKDSELAMLELIASAKFNGKKGKTDEIKLLSMEKQCDLLKYALAHALLDSPYQFDLSGAKRKFRKAVEEE